MKPILDSNGDPTGNVTLIFSAAGTSDPNGILEANEAIQFFESNTVNFNDNSQTNALATATDGTPTFSLGFNSLANYWYSPVVPEDPFKDPDTDPSAIGETYAGLNFIDLPPWLIDKVNDPNESQFNTWVDFWFNSEIFTLYNWGTANEDTLMHFGSNDPGVHHPGIIPEPSTFLLLGGGLVGLLVLRRKQSRS